MDVIYHNVKITKLAMINFPFIHLQVIVHGSATQKVGDNYLLWQQNESQNGVVDMTGKISFGVLLIL